MVEVNKKLNDIWEIQFDLIKIDLFIKLIWKIFSVIFAKFEDYIIKYTWEIK